MNAAFIQFAIRARAEHNVAIGRYDHLHLFVCGPDDFQLGHWIGILKRHLAGATRPIEASRPIWQRGFFDHLLRSEESYGRKWNYVRENPVRAGLVARVEDWPFAGEIVIIDRI